jgi:hypothetical protein
MRKKRIVPRGKRIHSRPFVSRGTTKRYLLDAIPAGFWRSVRSTARAKQISMRALILTLLEEWMSKIDAEDEARAAVNAEVYAESEPHIVGTEAPTPENDPVGRFTVAEPVEQT